MGNNAFVAYFPRAEPWSLERALITEIPLPLNLDMNAHHPFRPILSEIRRKARDEARRLPIVGM
jgi:hypothetical protein